MHQGNLFVDKEGNIIPVDFGIMGRLDKSNRKFLAEFCMVLSKRLCESSRCTFSSTLVPQEASKIRSSS